MGDINRRVARVIVRVGKAPSSLASAFDYIERLLVAPPEAFDVTDEKSSSPASIFHHPERPFWPRSAKM